MSGAACPADVCNAASLPARLLVEDLCLGGWIPWCPATSRDGVVVGERPAGERPLTPIPGSGGQVRAPCAIAGLGTDDFEPRVAMTLPRDPELGRRQTASNSRGNSTSWVLPGNRSIKAIVSVLGGLIGHGGAEFHLPLLFEFSTLQRSMH